MNQKCGPSEDWQPSLLKGNNLDCAFLSTALTSLITYQYEPPDICMNKQFQSADF